MPYKNFLFKCAALVLMLMSLAEYNGIARERAMLVAENQEKIEEVLAYNESLQALKEESASSPYSDGTFYGSGKGFGGEIRVSVEISQGKLTCVTILSARNEDEAYFAMAEKLTEKIVREQGIDVDIVSGATFSSAGILEAVDDALKGALK